METSEKDAHLKHKVLVVCNDGDYFLRHRLAVVTRLVSIGTDVCVIAGGSPIPENRIAGWKYIHVRIERFHVDPVSDFQLMVRTVRILLDFKPDAVHLITLKPMIVSGLASIASRYFHGYPRNILITLPGLGRMLSKKRAGERRYPVGTALTLLLIRFLARQPRVHITFETKHDYEFWEKKGIVNETNSTVIDGAGVDPELFYPAKSPRGHFRIKVLFAGRFLKSKGLVAFLMSANALAGRPDVGFLVAGIADDQDPDVVKPDRLTQLREIRFLGNVEDMPNLLRSCDIVCLPTSYGEGIPRILIEASATGLASIVSSHPGCLEIVKNGVTGKVLSATSDDELGRELTQAVLSYLNDPISLRENQEAAHKHFLGRGFNQESVVARFVELLGAGSS